MKKMNRKKFQLGFNSQGDFIGIDESRRPEHLAIYGVDTRAREITMIELAKEAIKQRGGATFIVETPFLAGALYLILKEGKKKRNIFWLNADHSLGVKNQGLWLEEYDESIMDRYVFNYQEAIENNALVIIDMETLVNGENGLRLKRYLMKHLLNKLAVSPPTNHAGHDVYIEHVEGFEKEIEPLIFYGPSLNCGVRLLLESPSVLKDRLPMIGSYIRHVVLLPQFHAYDADYLKVTMGVPDEKVMFYRSEGTALISTRNELGERKLRRFELPPIDGNELSLLIANGKRAKAGIYQKFSKEEDDNNRLIEIQNAQLQGGDWRQTSQHLVSLSMPIIPKSEKMDVKNVKKNKLY